MHLPLSAGKIVMLWSLLRDVTAFLSCGVRFKGGVLALERTAVTSSSNVLLLPQRFCLSFIPCLVLQKLGFFSEALDLLCDRIG